MSTLDQLRPATLLVSLLAALTTWVTLLSWRGFAEQPSGYLVPLFGACLLVAVLGMLLRAARLPALLVAAVQVVALLVWMQMLVASPQMVGGLVPTPDSLRALGDAVRRSSIAAQSYAAPVPVSVPEFYPLMILAGSGTAVLVDFLAVGLRRAPLAGLPLLAVYTAPISILDGGVSWLTFAVAALCFLFLVAADEGRRLTHWGHRLTPGAGWLDTSGRTTGSGAVWVSARKIGFTATALAVVVPLLVPTFDGNLFNRGGGQGDGDGSAVSISNPMVDLRRDLTRGVDVNLVWVTTSDPDPSYLRTTVLNTFDGNAWRPSGRDIPIKQRAKGTVAPPPGLPSTVPVKDYSSTVEVTDAFRSRWLPAPYPVTAVDAPGDWRYDRSTMDFISAADGQTTAGLSYRFRALQVGPTAAQLANAGAAPLSVSTPNTTLPKEFPAAVRRLAQSVTEDQASGFEKAVALQKWFREDGGFTYSLERSAGNGTDDLLTFLGTGRNSRVGYCEQFAAAMAVMGRALSIPSRVAVGFLRPEKVRGQTYVYSSHDLHAWPEMYFGGVGWVRFEPTPESHTGQLLPAYTTQSVPQAAPLASSSAPTSAPSANSVNRSADQQTSDAGSGTGSSGPNPVALALLALLVVAALLLLAPRALREVVRRRRWTVPERPEAWVEAGWREIRDTSVDLAIGWDDHVSVRRTGSVLEDCLARPGDQDDVWSGRPERGPSVNPEATEALRRLVGLLERARYARSLPAGATTREEVRADVDTCVAALRAGAGRRRQTWARWLPMSVFTSVGRHRRRPVRTTGVPVGDPGVDRAV